MYIVYQHNVIVMYTIISHEYNRFIVFITNDKEDSEAYKFNALAYTS